MERNVPLVITSPTPASPSDIARHFLPSRFSLLDDCGKHKLTSSHVTCYGGNLAENAHNKRSIHVILHLEHTSFAFPTWFLHSYRYVQVHVLG